MMDLACPTLCLAPPYMDLPIPPDVSSKTAWFGRLQHVTRQVACAYHVQILQRREGRQILFPCNWCGYPSGDWCEGCHDSGHRPATPLCSYCEARLRRCRICRLELQQVHRPTRVLEDSAWRNTSLCAGCDKRGVWPLCTGCRVCRFCSEECMNASWKLHRGLCKFLQTRQPVSITFPWQTQRIRHLRRNAPEQFPPPLPEHMQLASLHTTMPEEDTC